MASSYSGVRNRSRDETSPPSGQNPFADDGQNNPPQAGYAEDGPSQDAPRNQNRTPASGYAEGSSRDQNRPPAQTGYAQDGPEGQPRRSRSSSPSDRHRRNNSSRFSLFVIIPLLATLLIILAFALAIATTASSRWASKRAYSNSSDISGYLGIIHRNPFGPCVISLNPSSSSPQADNQTCIVPQYDLSVGKSVHSPGWDTPLICSALKLTKNLLIAGCILLGLAFIISLVLFAIGFFPPADEEREAGIASGLKLFGWSPSARFTSLVALLLLLLVASAAFCIAIAQLLGAWGFLTQQLPNARFGRPGTPSFLGAWYADQGLSLAGAAWVCAGFAALFVPIAWRMPRGYI